MNGHYKAGDVVLGNWTIIRAIGEGSYGTVFEAQRNDVVKMKAAIKIITVPQKKDEVKSLSASMDNRSISTYYQGYVDEIAREIALMSSLEGNSNIVSYGDHAVVKHEDGIGWDIIIRMELLTPLLDYIKSKPLTEKDVIKVGTDICSALELCSERNIVHRDVKPGNIFVSDMGTYKLGDFGIARTVEKTTGGLSIKGSPDFMAPEVYKGQDYSPNVDQYSLGLVLYYLLNDNRTPFLPPPPEDVLYGDSETSIKKRFLGEELPCPRNASPALSKIVLKACAYNPRDRYSDPKEMKAELIALNDLQKEKPELPKVLPGEPTPNEGTISIFPKRPSIQIRFFDAEGNILSSRNYSMNEAVQVPKVSDYTDLDGNKYIFTKWEPDLNVAALRSVDYTAVYEKKPIAHRSPNKLWIPIVGAGAAVIVVGALLAIHPWRGGGSSTEDKTFIDIPIPTATATITPSSVNVSEAPVQTPEPIVELEWSGWDDTLPNDISADNYAITFRQVYRSTPLYRVEDSDSPGAEFTLYKTEYSDFGPWSSWTTTHLESNDLTDVEIDTQSTWSAWSAWSTTKVTKTSTVDVETKEVSTWSAWSAWETVRNKNQIPDGSPNKQVNWKEVGNAYHTATHYEYQTRTLNTTTQYRSRTLSTTTRYRSRTRQRVDYYYDNRNWTTYSVDLIQISDDILVQSKMQYRYAVIEGGQFAEPSMANFPRFYADYTGHYEDVNDDAWYGANNSTILRTADGLGILLPDSYMNFYPANNITIGEVIRASVMIYRIYNGYTALLGANDGHYQMYSDYAVEKGIIMKGEFPDLTRDATRQELAYILFNALPEKNWRQSMILRLFPTWI